MRFEGQVALVTGGGSGIGLATVERFVQEGARVAVGDVDKARLDRVQEAFGDAVAVVPCDVTDEDAVEALARTAVDAFGRLDVAFANAGIGTSGLIVDSDVDDWKRTVDVCLVGPMLTIKHAARG
jgi:NAD(P)-dependent dehydrogenase (short-subunit alcohol dehydrogenase family)